MGQVRAYAADRCVGGPINSLTACTAECIWVAARAKTFFGLRLSVENLPSLKNHTEILHDWFPAPRLEIIIRTIMALISRWQRSLSCGATTTLTIQPRILSGTWRQSDQFPILIRSASDENWKLSIDQIPHVPLVLHGCITTRLRAGVAVALTALRSYK